jgi:hypothetical protein
MRIREGLQQSSRTQTLLGSKHVVLPSLDVAVFHDLSSRLTLGRLPGAAFPISMSPGGRPQTVDYYLHFTGCDSFTQICTSQLHIAVGYCDVLLCNRPWAQLTGTPQSALMACPAVCEAMTYSSELCFLVEGRRAMRLHTNRRFSGMLNEGNGGRDYRRHDAPC